MKCHAILCRSVPTVPSGLRGAPAAPGALPLGFEIRTGSRARSRHSVRRLTNAATLRLKRSMQDRIAATGNEIHRHMRLETLAAVWLHWPCAGAEFDDSTVYIDGRCIPSWLRTAVRSGASAAFSM